MTYIQVNQCNNMQVLMQNPTQFQDYIAYETTYPDIEYYYQVQDFDEDFYEEIHVIEYSSSDEDKDVDNQFIDYVPITETRLRRELLNKKPKNVVSDNKNNAVKTKNKIRKAYSNIDNTTDGPLTSFDKNQKEYKQKMSTNLKEADQTVQDHVRKVKQFSNSKSSFEYYYLNASLNTINDYLGEITCSNKDLLDYKIDIIERIKHLLEILNGNAAKYEINHTDDSRIQFLNRKLQRNNTTESTINGFEKNNKFSIKNEEIQYEKQPTISNNKKIEKHLEKVQVEERKNKAVKPIVSVSSFKRRN